MKTQCNQTKQKLSYLLFRSLNATFPFLPSINSSFNSPDDIYEWIDKTLKQMDSEIATVLLPVFLDRLQQIIIYRDSENEK